MRETHADHRRRQDPDRNRAQTRQRVFQTSTEDRVAADVSPHGRTGPQRAHRQAAEDRGDPAQAARLPPATPRPSRCRRTSTTRCGSARRPTRPTPKTASISTSAGSGITPAGSSATGARTCSTPRNGPTTPSAAARSKSRAQGTYWEGGLYNTVKDYDVTYRYANGVVMTCKPGNPSIKFIGTDGWVGNSGWRGAVEASSPEILNSIIGPDEIHLYTNPEGEHDDFLKCVKSRKDPYFPVDIGHRVSTVCHLANIAIKLGRKLKWDPKAERFEDDADANEMLSAPHAQALDLELERAPASGTGGLPVSPPPAPPCIAAAEEPPPSRPTRSPTRAPSPTAAPPRPVKHTGRLTARPASAATRCAMAFCTPAAMSAGATPSASSPMISVSANTTHMLLISAACWLSRLSSPSVRRSTPSRAATTSRNRPLPAAHRSFIAKSRTRPPLFQQDELAVLPADFDDGAGFRRQVMHPSGVAGNLGDRRVRKPHRVAPVAGGHDRADRRPIQSRLAQVRSNSSAAKPLLLHALVSQPGADDRVPVRYRTAALWSPATPHLCRRKSSLR